MVYEYVIIRLQNGYASNKKKYVHHFLDLQELENMIILLLNLNKFVTIK